MVDGTTDENFTKAPVKVMMPEKRKTKKGRRNRPARSVRSSLRLVFNILLFIVAPLLLTNVLLYRARLGRGTGDRRRRRLVGNDQGVRLEDQTRFIRPWVAFNLIDGLIRMVFFIMMIFSMSFLKDIRRVFEYHGAEHKTVFTWEKGLDLTPANATMQKRQHPRCGTSFLMVVMLVAIVLFSVINFEAMWLNLVVRIALMPLVAGLVVRSYSLRGEERIGCDLQIYDACPACGCRTSRRRNRTSEQLEVAIKALDESLKLEPQTSLSQLAAETLETQRRSNS